MDFPYGKLLADIPPEFVPVEMWPEYGFIALPLKFCSREEVGTAPKGIRWSAWPLTFELYVTDQEPNLDDSKRGVLARNRMVLWRRVRRTDVPAGWHRLSSKPSQLDGYRQLDGDVTSGWQKNARRDLRLWQENYAGKTHRIERIDVHEFTAGYRAGLVSKRIGYDRLEELERVMTLPLSAAHIQFWGVRNIESNALVAGTAILVSPTCKGSTHIAPFINEEGRRVFAATALIHHWFMQAQARGERFVITANFWFPGKPRGWKGFSEFKSHFGWQYVAYPPELTRFVRGRLF